MRTRSCHVKKEEGKDHKGTQEGQKVKNRGRDGNAGNKLGQRTEESTVTGLEYCRQTRREFPHPCTRVKEKMSELDDWRKKCMTSSLYGQESEVLFFMDRQERTNFSMTCV